MTERKLDLSLVLTFENPWWVARCLEVEVASQGRTEAEAVAMVRESLELYFDDDAAAPPIPLEDAHLERLQLRISA
ncbi:type II toxin-antitoxin system HicB family antitoxin [Uniformispora flossi]|uniref:type II toxin-antitoxin system HicB family antitoxin n=1 Tax=Uniformispora flossi TaxID=3390723 RepID=UPI003C2CF907